MIHTLGNFTDALGRYPADMPVRYQNGGTGLQFCSWRGSYCELTLDATGTPSTQTVAELLQAAIDADGATFGGYKGGDFVMNRWSELYADEWGYCPGERIQALIVDNGELVLITDAQAWLDA